MLEMVAMKTSGGSKKNTGSPSDLIDARIADLGDWRGETLAKVRALIHEAIPEVVEEWKWRGTPTWYYNDGIICTGETYKDKVKMTFAKGASLQDPAGLFNSSLDGNVRRAIDISEGEKLNQKALKELLKAAAELNEPKGKAGVKTAAKPAKGGKTAAKPAKGAKAASKSKARS